MEDINGAFELWSKQKHAILSETDIFYFFQAADLLCFEVCIPFSVGLIFFYLFDKLLLLWPILIKFFLTTGEHITSCSHIQDNDKHSWGGSKEELPRHRLAVWKSMS